MKQEKEKQSPVGPPRWGPPGPNNNTDNTNNTNNNEVGTCFGLQPHRFITVNTLFNNYYQINMGSHPKSSKVGNQLEIFPAFSSILG